MSRWITEIDAGRLGKLGLVIEGADAGVKIVISVADRLAAAAVRADQQSLVDALQSSGLTVKSVKSTARISLGTGLAHVRAGTNARVYQSHRRAYMSLIRNCGLLFQVASAAPPVSW